jgi:hypothetical protein
MVLTDSHRISRVPRYSGYCYHLLQLTYTGLSPSMAVLSNTFYFVEQQISQSYNPSTAETVLVWAIPISLATTMGITIVFSSSGYLDVSVLRVCPLAGNTTSWYWVSPLLNFRIKGYVHLPEAYRSLSRPSSPLEA